jgi:hypothetical protein
MFTFHVIKQQVSPELLLLKKKREEEEEEVEEREPLKEIRWRSAGDSPERRWR